MKSAWMWTLALAGLLVAGCSSSTSNDSTDGPTGSVPTISDLSLTPLELDVGKTTTLTGSIAIQDDDGDIEKIGLEVTLPDGSKQTLPSVEAQGASGLKDGELRIALLLGPPTKGDYELAVFVMDSKGHESNHLSTTVTAK